jgi:hypothetical protein
LQQICSKQSLSCVHVMAQVAAQRPLQQVGVASSPAHCDDETQVFGQGCTAGSRQRPVALRLGSTAWTVVQQISPRFASHCASRVQAAGQALVSVQIGRS